MTDFTDADIWDVADVLRSPMSGFVQPLEAGESPSPVSMEQVDRRRDAARDELVRRGFTDEQIGVLEEGGKPANRIITDFLAGGG